MRRGGIKERVKQMLKGFVVASLEIVASTVPARRYIMSMSPFYFCRAFVHLFAFLVAVSAPEAWATHSQANCDQRDKLLSLLSGRPHYEQQALVMMDELPGQGHRLELFMNSGEGGRHSYTLLRIRRGGNQACIVSAGVIASKSQDKRGRSHLNLNDENDPDVFDIVTCHRHYIITRAFVDKDVCDLKERLYGTSSFIVSYGRIHEDHRTLIPWPSN